MDHAQTIAMATDLLAEGRAEDVVQMVDPLLEPVDAPAASTGQLLLHALRARVEIVHRDHPERAFDLLPTLPEVHDLCTCVRAEVALWRGWARARTSRDSADAPRALRLLRQAEELFDTIHDPRGRCWSVLGRAQAYFGLDEYGLMRRALEDASSLVEKRTDEQADRWLHELSIPALRFEGRYNEAERHVHELRVLAKNWNDRRIRGAATAHEAALRYDLGQAPSKIVETAETAEALLRRVDGRARYPLLAAYHAHVGALLRRGRWADALAIIDEAETAVRDDPSDQAHLRTLRARIALRKGTLSRAEDLLDDLVEQAHHLPHGLQRSHIALLHGRILARRNRLDEAYTWIQRAHRNARETGHRGNQLRTLLTMARAAAARSDLDVARSHLDAADAYDDYFSVLPFAVRRFSTEGTIAQAANRTQDATDAYRHALSAASMIQDRYRTASLQLALAQLEGDDRAHALASAAHATFEAMDAPDEAEVAAALADGISSSDDHAVPALPHPAPSTSDATLETTLARASLSVPLVANTWLQTTASLLPDRWIGVYRLSTDGIASLVHERGPRPDGVRPPSGTPSDDEDRGVEWLRLHASRPTLALGIEAPGTPDAEWRTALEELASWIPLIRLALERALLHQEHTAPRSPSDAAIPIDGFIAESDTMQSVLAEMYRVRTSHSPILITGESGVGKRLLARAVHTLTERDDGPLRHVACANMQREPIARRLFGAVDTNGRLTPGAVHEADGGTLVIEDVDALPPPAQASLLHLLDVGEVVPEGGTEATPIDVRVIATTDERLEEQIRNDHFRPALYERLNVVSLHMPPLRHRRADIPLLVRHFLDALRPDRSSDAVRPSVTQPAMEALLQYDWPGNVRQLRNELERALVYVGSEPTPTIDRDVLLDTIVEQAQSKETTIDDPDDILRPNQTLSDVLSETEAAVIERVLRACEGQVTASAEVLGLSRQGLYKKMKRLGIDASDFQPDPDPAAASS